MRVPNQFPVVDPGALRLAVCAESPGQEEQSWAVCAAGHGYARQAWREAQLVEQRFCPACGSPEWTARPTPLVGPSGRHLDYLLQAAGLPRSRVFVGNVSQEPLTEAEVNDPAHPAVVEGLAVLAADLAAFRPNAILCLGGAALRAFHPRHWTRRGTGAKAPYAVGPVAYRGSIFAGYLLDTSGGGAAQPQGSQSPDSTLNATAPASFTPPSFKCISALHPDACLGQPKWTPFLDFDVKRAVREAASPALDLPERRQAAWTTADDLVALLEGLRQHKRLGHDIEGWAANGVTDCSFAWTPNDAVWVPFRRIDGSPWWSPHDEGRLLTAVRALLMDPDIVKVCWNGLYEGFVWGWRHLTPVRPMADPMLKWQEAACELERGLDVVASFVTRQPYWGTSEDPATEAERAAYNCTDSCVTLEIDEALDGAAPDGTPFLTAAQKAHYEHRLRLLAPCLYGMLKGFAFDAAGRAERLAALNNEAHGLQGELDLLAGIAPPEFKDVVATVVHKRKQAVCVDWPDLTAQDEHVVKGRRIVTERVLKRFQAEVES